METRRWMNQSQPQTLVIAVFLLYARAFFTLLFGLDPLVEIAFANSGAVSNLLRLFVVAGGVGAGYGIANERKWGYYLGIAVAALPLLARVYVSFKLQVNPLSFDLVGLLFDGALFALLVHTQSREYQRIWFK
jgi:hypothetical protein